MGLTIVGLPVALVLAWAFELTPQGLRTEPTSRAREEAEPVVRTLTEQHSDSPFTSTARALFHGLRGERAAALEAISPALREAGRRTEMFSRFIAESHALAGDIESALDWLERAVELGMANYPYLSRIDPFLENVRGDRRFRELMERVEAEWRAFQE